MSHDSPNFFLTLIITDDRKPNVRDKYYRAESFWKKLSIRYYLWMICEIVAGCSAT